MEKSLGTPVRYLKGIGPKRARSFEKAGINTVEDLLYRFPRLYQDRTRFSPVAGLKVGEVQTIKAKVVSCAHRESFRRRGFSITEAIVSDASGKVACVWFNQPYLKQYFKPGLTVILSGKVEEYAARLQMSSPEFEFISEEEKGDSLDTGRIVPVYSLPEGFTQRAFRAAVSAALDEYLIFLKDPLPYAVRSRHSLGNLALSLRSIHFPESFKAREEAFRRLSFEEFFFFQIPLALRKAQRSARRGIAHTVEGKLADAFIAALGFKLTAAQGAAIEEIKSDMQKPLPMQRLLQGDVGSGKTVVATAACMICIQGGYQAAFMVPTEILAKQHFEKISAQVKAMGAYGKKVRPALLTGSAAPKEKEGVSRRIREGEANLVIGTHALLEQGVSFRNLGLVVIDEQHKFGVGQRQLLPQKGANPDVLIMTATPIPRTLAITLYGDLDISVMRQLPAGRLPVKTILLGKEREDEAFEVARAELIKGRQVYVVYPVIEESYALDIAGAEKIFRELKAGRFRGFEVGLVHGRLAQAKQDEVMRRFKDGEINLLVATTVLEVGIDVANATCMIIAHAERFGLAQLHQLRGRIGRGSAESYCILVAAEATEQAKRRLEAMVRFSDGFRIAEEDLKIRGPGEFFGQRQSGLTELKIANPLTQMQLLRLAREEALALVAKDARLEAREHLSIRQELLRRFPEYERLMVAA